MAHQYKIGDKVRIIEREGFDSSYPLVYTDVMNIDFAGRIVTIDNIVRNEASDCTECTKYNGDDNGYRIKEDGHTYFWHSSMFEPVLEEQELKPNIPSFSIPLKEGDLVEICGMIGSIHSDWNDFEYYLDFDNIRDDQEHFKCCKKLRKLVPDFEKIANEFGSVRSPEVYFFPAFSTIGALVKFAQAVNKAYNSKKSITTPKTLNENEIRFQKPEATATGGFVPTGHPIRGREHKVTVVIGHLSNQKISC